MQQKLLEVMLNKLLETPLKVHDWVLECRNYVDVKLYLILEHIY